MYWIIFLLLFWSPLFSATPLISLKGHLSSEVLKTPLSKITNLKEPEILLEINSTSGDLAAVLDFAKALYEKKQTQKLKITVYLHDNALGTSAIIPFLADDLFASLFVSWGDVPLGAEKALPTNILRNRVVSLIAPDKPNASLLRMLASAMTDPSVQIIDDNGWKIKVGSLPSNAQLISTEGSPLVINQNQLKQLGLVKELLTPEEFQTRFLPPAKELPPQTSVQAPSPEESKLAKYLKFTSTGPNKVGLITIDDRTSGISQATWIYVKAALDYYKKIHPTFIILQLNTPGGEVFAAQKISDALKDMDTQNGIPIVCFINNWAISAGAMLAYSCRFITTVKDGSMGAAEPVIESAGKMETASEKVNSALRTDFANRAAFFDRNPYIAEAMVDKDVILVERYGKVIKLDNENQIRTVGPDPDIIISPKGKLLTLNAEQMLKYGVADILLTPKQLAPITPEEKKAGKWPASKMLLFQDPYFAQIPQDSIDEYQMDWKTQFFALLAHPIVSSLLFLGLILGIYAEINSPGLGLPATIAMTCLFLIILSSFSQEIASWLEVILLFTGLAILLVEVFILPTFGLLGFIGIVFFLMGLFGLMLPGIGEVNYEFDTKTLNAAGEAFVRRLAWLSGTLVVALGLMIAMTRFIRSSSGGIFKKFVLSGHEQDASAGYISGENPMTLPPPGSKGTAATTLRPSGKVTINDIQYDAITSGGFIEQDSPIIVERLDGSVIVVNAQSEENPS